jgi:hypothetical protein
MVGHQLAPVMVCATGAEVTVGVCVEAVEVSVAAINAASPARSRPAAPATTTRPRVPKLRCAIRTMVTGLHEAGLKRM